MKSDNFIVIQGWMVNELHLSGNDLLVYAIINQFCQDGETKFSGSLQYLADWCNATKQGIQKNLKNLLEKGLIVKEETVINGVKFVAYYTTKLHTIQLGCTNNIDISTLDNTNTQQVLLTDNTNKEDTYKIKAQKFVDDFNKICVSLPKCMRLTAKRSKGISNLIKKYSEEEILKVFTKLEASDFCTGRNGKWRADIDFILREDKFISVLEGKYDNQRGRSCNVETISHGDRKQLTSEERERIFRNGKKF